jgi:hypothetical protein
VYSEPTKIKTAYFHAFFCSIIVHPSRCFCWYWGRVKNMKKPGL